jgi:DNA-binding NarL/FixJ family response regulator
LRVIRCFHVDDDDRVRAGFSALLARAMDFSVVASVGTAREAVEALAGGLEFELAIVDLGLPDGSGLDVIRQVRRVRPSATPLVFTVFDDPERVFGALQAGARGYLLKDVPPARMLQALRDATDGGAPLSPAVARQIVDSFSPQRRPDDDLTRREREVLVCLVRGDTYDEAAAALGITLSTVQSHVRTVYAKLEVTSKAGATREAIRRGIVCP